MLVSFIILNFIKPKEFLTPFFCLKMKGRFFDHPINPDSLFNWRSGVPLKDSIYLNAYDLRFPAYGSGGYGIDIHNHNGTSSTRYYKIRKGDTLYGIAIKNHTTVKRLCVINGIKKILF
jgi:hypothetical protein